MAAVERIKSNPWQATPKLRYDSSDDDGDESDDDMELNDTVDTDINPSKSTSQLDELFFFHPDDPVLANRINGEIYVLLKKLLRGGCRVVNFTWFVMYTVYMDATSYADFISILFAQKVSQCSKISGFYALFP